MSGRDAILNLPVGLYSYGLRKLAAAESARSSFGAAAGTLAGCEWWPVAKYDGRYTGASALGIPAGQFKISLSQWTA